MSIYTFILCSIVNGRYLGECLQKEIFLTGGAFLKLPWDIAELSRSVMELFEPTCACIYPCNCYRSFDNKRHQRDIVKANRKTYHEGHLGLQTWNFWIRNKRLSELTGRQQGMVAPMLLELSNVAPQQHLLGRLSILPKRIHYDTKEVPAFFIVLKTASGNTSEFLLVCAFMNRVMSHQGKM